MNYIYPEYFPNQDNTLITMKKKEAFRLYKFSDATLVTKGLEKIAFIKRDQIEFDRYNVVSVKREGLKTELTEFSDRETDIEALQEQVESTERKDKKAEELRVAIRGVMSCVELNFNVESAKYRKFGTDTLSRQTDAELLITAKRVVRVGTELLPILVNFGLTLVELDAITAMADDFTDLIVDQRLEIGERDIQQEDRVEAGNTIYSQLVKYTNLGQSIWIDNDKAKYNDYIMYNTVSGEAPATVGEV
ncbi:hypothetical protein [Flavobacterium sp.]